MPILMFDLKSTIKVNDYLSIKMKKTFNRPRKKELSGVGRQNYV
jgi:hypothetical protein